MSFIVMAWWYQPVYAISIQTGLVYFFETDGLFISLLTPASDDPILKKMANNGIIQCWTPGREFKSISMYPVGKLPPNRFLEMFSFI